MFARSYLWHWLCTLLEAGPWVKGILRTHCPLCGTQEGVAPDVIQTQEPPGPSIFTFLITSHPPLSLVGEVRASFLLWTLRNRP